MTNITKPSDINKIWSSGGDIIAPSDTKIQGGWLTEIPPRQYFNYIDNKQDQAIAHINQHGIAVWDSVTEYQAGASYVQGSDGIIYKARTTNTNIDPTTDVSFVNWTKAVVGGLLNTQVFTSSGIYTPTPGTNKVRVRVIGGGGGGGAIPSTTSSTVAVGSGGAAGAYSEGILNSGFSGVMVTIGAGGAGGIAGNNNGASGGTSSFGALLSATGGTGGLGSPTQVPPYSIGGGIGGSSSGGYINAQGNGGGTGIITTLGSYQSGIGAGSAFGGGANSSRQQAQGAGAAGVGPGSGGAGAAAGGTTTTAALAGGAGAAGIVIIEEFT